MKSQHLSTIAVLILAALLAACGGQAAGSPPAATREPAMMDTVSLMDALRAAGATVEPIGEVSQPFFSVEGQVINVNGGDVQVYEYESKAEAGEEAALVSQDGSSVGATMITWIATPHFFKTGKLIALYVGDDDAVLTALVSALGPQFAGGSPKF